ncbi:MAG: glycosyltransferase family 4 protein [Parcubacteria group bacterium]|jgi:glycosyltransferase involved in cell wall biosynthesis
MKQKILIIIHPHLTLPGGAGKVVLELGKQLSKEMRVVIIAQKINQNYIDEYPELEFKSIDGPITSSFSFWFLFPWWYQKTARTIDSLRKKGEVSILCNVFPANWIGLLYKSFHKEIHCSWFCHEPSAFIHVRKWRNAIVNPVKKDLANFFFPLFSIIDKKLTGLADEIFANSNYSKRIIRKCYQRDSVVIYPGVNHHIYKPVPFEQKKNYILTVGRLTKFKNNDMIITALSKIENKEISLYIVGNGEEKENLQKLAKKLNIENRVRIFANISNREIIQFYAQAKIFILGSKNEPFGIVPIEAMSCGTAVIVDNSGGPSETILNGKSGKCIDFEVEKLTEAINELLSDEKTLKEMSIFGRIYAQENFSWEKSAEKIREIF